MIDRRVCELSGVPLRLTRDDGAVDRTADTLSIDRIDPEKGYVYGNIRVVALCLNTAFNLWGEDAAAPIIAKYLASKDHRTIDEALLV